MCAGADANFNSCNCLGPKLEKKTPNSAIARKDVSAVKIRNASRIRFQHFK